MSRLSSNSISRLQNCDLDSIELAYKEDRGFVILCDVKPGSGRPHSAPLGDGKGFCKFYATKLAAVRAIQRVRSVPSSDFLVRYDYFTGDF